MSQVALRADRLGKRYRIGESESYLTLRDVLARSFRAPWRLLRRAAGYSSNHRPEFIWALKDISLEVGEGEVVGIIGRNGAGKTTLLKILARVTRPTEGYAEVRGRLGSLLEVGTGFHPELTGRENVYLSGAILGMSKREIERKFDEIVDFAEIEKFLDTPVKHYSSGMYMRLAFAVAAHLEPDILLVDEVLAVGDIAFQKKCLGKMGDVARGGRTVLFVSHNMGAIGQLCRRCVLLQNGRVAVDAAPEQSISTYLEEIEQGEGNSSERWERSGSGRVRITSVVTCDRKGSVCSRVSMGGDLHIRVAGTVQKEDLQFSLAVQVATTTGVPVLYLYDQFRTFRAGADMTFLIEIFIPQLLLMPGLYYLHIWVGQSGIEEFDYVRNAVSFDVVQSARVPITLPIEQQLGLIYCDLIAEELK